MVADSPQLPEFCSGGRGTSVHNISCPHFWVTLRPPKSVQKLKSVPKTQESPLNSRSRTKEQDPNSNGQWQTALCEMPILTFKKAPPFETPLNRASFPLVNCLSLRDCPRDWLRERLHAGKSGKVSVQDLYVRTSGRMFLSPRLLVGP